MWWGGAIFHTILASPGRDLDYLYPPMEWAAS